MFQVTKVKNKEDVLIIIPLTEELLKNWTTQTL